METREILKVLDCLSSNVLGQLIKPTFLLDQLKYESLREQVHHQFSLFIVKQLCFNQIVLSTTMFELISEIEADRGIQNSVLKYYNVIKKIPLIAMTTTFHDCISSGGFFYKDRKFVFLDSDRVVDDNANIFCALDFPQQIEVDYNHEQALVHTIDVHLSKQLKLMSMLSLRVLSAFNEHRYSMDDFIKSFMNICYLGEFGAMKPNQLKVRCDEHMNIFKGERKPSIDDFKEFASEINDHLFDSQGVNGLDCYCPKCYPDPIGLTLIPEIVFYFRTKHYIFIFDGSIRKLPSDTHDFSSLDTHLSIIDTTERFKAILRYIKSLDKIQFSKRFSELHEDWDEKSMSGIYKVALEPDGTIHRINSKIPFTYISHVWETKSHPDPSCNSIILSLKRFRVIWYDYISLPQRDLRDFRDEFRLFFEGSMLSMYEVQMVASCTVKMVNEYTKDLYNHRAWCIMEQSFIGSSPKMELLYKYYLIHGFSQAMRMLNIHLTNMSDIPALQSYFGLKGGSTHIITNLHKKHDNGKVSRVLAKLKRIQYTLPPKSRLEISMPNNYLSVIEVVGKTRRSLVARVDNQLNNKRQINKKKSIHNHQTKLMILEQSPDHIRSLLTMKEVLCWVDELSAIRIMMEKTPDKIVEDVPLCKDKVFIGSKFYRNLCRGAQLTKNLNKTEILELLLSRLLPLKLMFWIRSDYCIDVLRRPIL